MEEGGEEKRLTAKQREGEDLGEVRGDREEESRSRHHKAEAVVVMSLEINGVEKRGEERGDTGERREREDDAMGDGERGEGEEERRSLQGTPDRERDSFKQRERQKIMRVRYS